ncbi:MAG: tRNA pseudouridine(13) synthase TruD [Thermoplasmata archaeon]|nr:tRNA pseudouridine(13) synthase TruD [Thermoplasmata archaeon]
MPVALTPPEPERSMGLRHYYSATDGTGGRLKGSPEHFEVREISAFPRPSEDGGFTILRIESTMREQHALVAEMGRALGVGPGAIAWAGTKDRRAVTEQLFSVHAVDLPLDRLALPGLRVLDAYRSRTGLVLGHHYGNSFRIRVDEVDLPGGELTERLGRTLEVLRGAGGFPNYFGLQRFGEVRPVTHLVGRALLRGEVADAVETYISAQLGEESGPGAVARAAYREHRDPARALREFPPAFQFERRMLEHLARGHTPERALRALPLELRILFIHAYQAWLFNEYLSGRIERGLSLTEPLVGDTVLRVARDGTVPGTGSVPVAEDNLPELRELVARRRGRVAGPLVGYASGRPRGLTAELLGPLLARDGITVDSFQLPATPEIASKGLWRPLLVEMPPVAWTTEASGVGTDRRAYRLAFALPKGAYATVLIRELTKSGATTAS